MATSFPSNDELLDPAAAGGSVEDEGTGPTAEGGTTEEAAANTPEPPEDAELLRLAEAADRQAVSFAQQNWQPAWRRSYQAFRSEYIAESKYKSADYRHRSKIFRPKTRISVTKDLAGAAQTLFSTVDAVSITAGDESDPMQEANAELVGALVNYRLDRTSGKNSVSWFLTAMGARQDCQIAGVCCSKQLWDYATRSDGRTIKDKPEILLIQPENVGLDPAASWIDPVNSGVYFRVRFPLHIQDVRDKMTDPKVQWIPVPQQDGKDEASIWNAARVKEYELSSVRRAREGGTDRLDNNTSTSPDFDVVWVYEWFIRTADGDWNFWTLGKNHLLSRPVPTEQAYPWKAGERPYRIGYGNLEAHRIVPQSPVETLQPLQQEINDITNLRLDNVKQVIQPVAKVKRGKKIDVDALKRRYPVLYVESTEDVEWDRPPESAASAFAETSRLDTDFDDLAGTFNGGSVANNRQVGETVGGMRLMAGAASAVSEFYIRLFVETWVEPVLADLAKLEAYYESDDKILALAKKRAPSMVKYGISEITDELLSQEVIVRVSAGVGSADPQQKLGKLGAALDMAAKVVQGSKKFVSGELQLNEEALLNEIFGLSGYRDGFDRFFGQGQPAPQPGEAPAPGASPEEIAAKDADRESKERIAAQNNKTKIVTSVIQHRANQRSQERDMKHDNKRSLIDTLIRVIEGQTSERQAAQQAAMRPALPAPGAPAGVPAF